MNLLPAASCSEVHMFWWLYHSPQRVDNGKTPWPTVLWLQGGPVSALHTTTQLELPFARCNQIL